MSKKNENNTQYKFILIGDSSVGKTSIFKKITTEIFSVKNISTIGMDKRTLNFKDIEVNINGENKKMDFDLILFDTAGQERYRSITKTYFQSSDGVIILYDITNKKTFEGVETWLESLDQVLSTWKTNHYVVTLLGNKLDLVTNGEKQREVEEEEASKLCSDKDIYWGGECSVKDFSVEELNDILITTWKNYVEKFGPKEAVTSQKRMSGSQYIKKPKKNHFC
jgi:small GTP-binding protein